MKTKIIQTYTGVAAAFIAASLFAQWRQDLNAMVVFALIWTGTYPFGVLVGLANANRMDLAGKALLVHLAVGALSLSVVAGLAGLLL